MHNINGLKGDSLKLERLVEHCKKEQFNLMGIVETNINEKEGEWFNIENRTYRSFWTDTEKDKKKGSGVGLLVDQDWSHHMGACKKFNPYLLKAEFYFRKVMLQVWIVYILPKNEEIAKKVHKIILEELIKNKKNTFHIVMGDFNATLNRELDTSSKGKRA